MRFLYGFFAGVLAAGCIGAAEINPLNLAPVANTAFADETPDDRSGGWTDQGSNDLRLLKSGDVSLSGVPFTILDDRTTKGKSCVVVSGCEKRNYLPELARVELEKPATGKMLYLLHAGAWLNPKKEPAGRLTVEYADGSMRSFVLHAGRDLADWQENRGAANAVRAWSVYNNNSQVSLYASKFPLEEKPVKALRFHAGADGVWMVAAASVGDAVDLKPLPEQTRLKHDYPAPEPVDPAELAKTPRTGTPKNIILIIGDGMGQGAVKLAGLHAHGRPQSLVMEQLPVNGMVKTASASSSVTDSAASGTALSSGYKTNNGYIGVTPEKQPMRSIAEEARESSRPTSSPGRPRRRSPPTFRTAAWRRRSRNSRRKPDIRFSSATGRNRSCPNRKKGPARMTATSSTNCRKTDTSASAVSKSSARRKNAPSSGSSKTGRRIRSCSRRSRPKR